VYECFKLLRQDYDLVIRTRPDNYFHGGLKLTDYDPAALWVPDHFNWGGWCDRLAFGGMAQMRFYCDLYNHLNDWTGTNAKGRATDQLIGNSETRLYRYLTGRDVRTFPLEFCCVQPDGRRRFDTPADRGDVIIPELLAATPARAAGGGTDV
jgi:hypothetical protein